MKSLLPTTYGELKCKKAELRNQLEKEITESGGNFNKGTCDDYRLVLRAIKWTESWLLWTIVSLILILTIGGCNAIDGARQDIHQWTDTPAHHK